MASQSSRLSAGIAGSFGPSSRRTTRRGSAVHQTRQSVHQTRQSVHQDAAGPSARRGSPSAVPTMCGSPRHCRRSFKKIPTSSLCCHLRHRRRSPRILNGRTVASRTGPRPATIRYSQGDRRLSPGARSSPTAHSAATSTATTAASPTSVPADLIEQPRKPVPAVGYILDDRGAAVVSCVDQGNHMRRYAQRRLFRLIG